MWDNQGRGVGISRGFLLVFFLSCTCLCSFLFLFCGFCFVRWDSKGGLKGVATPVSWLDVRTRTHGCLDFGHGI